MNSNLLIFYDIIKPRIDRFLVSRIAGDNIASGIEKYYQLKADLISDGSIDYAEILVSSLDSQILHNLDFIRLFILQCADEPAVDKLSILLSINENSSAFKRRKEILQKPLSKIRASLIKLYNLEEDFFTPPKVNKIVSRETISPFNPVPIKKQDAVDLIPSEYLSLHDYQKYIKDELSNKIIHEPNARTLVHMPTGSGKTKTSIEAIVDFIRVNLNLRFNKGTVLWFAHSKELCEQAYEAFKIIWRFKGDYEINAYRIFGDSDYREIRKCLNDNISIIFIGFQKFNSLYSSKPTDIESHKLKQFLFENTKLAVVDEAHKALANTYKKAIDFVTSMPDCRLIGLTATPGRSNFVTGDNENQELSEFFGSNIIRITDHNGDRIENPLIYLQEENVLARIEQEELDFTLDFTKFNYTAEELKRISLKDDIGEKELDIIATDPHRNSMIIAKIKECYENNDSILVFACSTNHCIILQRLLSSTEKIVSEVILGSTNKELRSQAIKRFKSNELKVIINYGVLSTGFDAPNLNTLIVARPTKSIVLYSQIVGRALRGPKNGGNELNKLITIRDNLVGFPNPDFMFSYWEEFWN